jgi:hypothetical protein
MINIQQARSIRAFIGSKTFDTSRAFYRDLGFMESEISADMSLFEAGQFSFYLQNAYVKDWIENTMLFIEVNNVHQCYEDLLAQKLDEKYDGVKLIPIKKDYWGEECFMIDPAGVLLHFGQFNN